MERFTTVTGTVAPLPIANVDTDQILPARFLRKPRDAGYGRFLLHDLRFDGSGVARPDVPMNRPAFAEATILAALDNFGCGSSREGAVYALVDHGFRVILAPSFGDIFYSNALKNGLLCVAVPVPSLRALIDRTLSSPVEITVDLPAQTVTLPGGTHHRFEIDDFRKDCLIRGLDELAMTLALDDRIRSFEDRRRAEAPWAELGDGTAIAP